MPSEIRRRFSEEWEGMEEVVDMVEEVEREEREELEREENLTREPDTDKESEEDEEESESDSVLEEMRSFLVDLQGTLRSPTRPLQDLLLQKFRTLSQDIYGSNGHIRLVIRFSKVVSVQSAGQQPRTAA
eukprot:symbB.v1.2.033853.t1/scaffold4263.1/size42195/4